MILVKIKKLLIKGLYGSVLYNVDFNEDITFLYGLNGCGKTTVLNITENIITGNLFYLFDYDFDMIELSYYDNQKEDSIIIKKEDNLLDIIFNKKQYSLQKIDKEFFSDSSNAAFKIERRYFEDNEVLREIKTTFNYLYLPLNRSTKNHMKYEEYRMYGESPYYRRKFGYDLRNVPENKIDNSLIDVEILIMDSMRKINSKLSSINDQFRNDILKSSLGVADFSLSDFKYYITNYNIKKINKIAQDYKRLLQNLNIISKEEQAKYDAFFSRIIKLSNEEYNTEKNDIAELIFNYRELIRIERFTKIASATEKEKEKLLSKPKLFVETINKFIRDSSGDKEIIINEEGNIKFIANNTSKPISVHYLSSGERQLLIFFANLIFNVDNSKNGIFVVDEPELSLHLYWQRIFVEEARKINPNIQMIFATHSPEFISKYRTKMFRLEKKYQ